MSYLEISKRLLETGFQSYMVGGAVRDMFMGDSPSDFDIATNATPSQLKELFSDCDVNLVGETFGVCIINGTEVATFRKDRNVISGAKNCEVTFADNIKDDLIRRDLTINGIAICCQTHKIIDFSNGINHIENKIIKFIGNPLERIEEDPNRIVRACRFFAKIDGVFDLRTKELLHFYRFYMTSVAPERIRLELLKAMKIQKASKFFHALASIGALEYIFPDLVECICHTHGNHHIEDVFEHMMITGDSISTKFPLLKLAGYLHDIGKPRAWKIGNDGKFIDHENLGHDILQEDLKRLKFSNDEIEFISNLTRLHMRSSTKLTPKGVRKTLKKLSESNISLSDHIRLHIADRKGNVGRENKTFGEIRDSLRRFKNCSLTISNFGPTDLAVSGGELIEIFNLPKNKIVSDLQKHLVEYVLEYGDERNTRKDLIQTANMILMVESLDDKPLFEFTGLSNERLKELGCEY